MKTGKGATGCLFRPRLDVFREVSAGVPGGEPVSRVDARRKVIAAVLRSAGVVPSGHGFRASFKD